MDAIETQGISSATSESAHKRAVAARRNLARAERIVPWLADNDKGAERSGPSNPEQLLSLSMTLSESECCCDATFDGYPQSNTRSSGRASDCIAILSGL